MSIVADTFRQLGESFKIGIFFSADNNEQEEENIEEILGKSNLPKSDREELEKTLKEIAERENDSNDNTRKKMNVRGVKGRGNSNSRNKIRYDIEKEMEL